MEYFTQEVVDTISSEQLEAIAGGSNAIAEAIDGIREQGLALHGMTEGKGEALILKKSDDLNILEMDIYHLVRTFTSSGALDALIKYLKAQSLASEVNSTIMVLDKKLEAGVIEEEEYKAALERLPNNFISNDEEEEEEDG